MENINVSSEAKQDSRHLFVSPGTKGQRLTIRSLGLKLQHLFPFKEKRHSKICYEELEGGKKKKKYHFSFQERGKLMGKIVRFCNSNCVKSII